MPAMNHRDTVSTDDIIQEANALTDTSQIGEDDHSDHEQIGESNSNRSVRDDSSFNDRYFPLILAHIGSISSFNALYSRDNEQAIGVGAESAVYKYTNRENGEKVAVQETILSSKAQLIHWFAKYLMIKQCGFYSQYDAFLKQEQSSFTVYLVQELLTKNLTEILTDLHSENKQQGSQKMDELEVKRMVSQIVTQLNALQENHSHNHCDIKPTNIMRRRDGSYTLIDFGFAMESNATYSGYLGTKEWSAPEMIPKNNAKNVISESIDMWSIGLVIIYCLFSGHHPFCSKRKRIQKKQRIQNIEKWYNRKVKGKQCSIESYLGRKLIANQISYDLFDFLFKCLRFDPSKRLTPNEALHHKWLQCQ